MIYTYSLTLDIYNNNSTYRAKQNDAGSRYLLASITANGVEMAIPDTATVSLKVVKPDHKKTFTTGVVTEGKILVELTNQTLAVSGIAHCELQILDSDSGTTELLKTIRFKLMIDAEVYSDTVLESSDEFTALTEALAKVGTIGNLADLHTIEKSTFTGAVNELADNQGTITDLTTTAETLVGAINELDSEKEDKSNKVISIDSESTDTQYPSAKLTYDQLALKEPNLPATPETPAEKFLNGNRSWATPAHNKITDLNTDENYQHITTTQVNKLTNIEENAEVNIIETVSIDGADITPDANRNIDIPLATSTKDGAMSSEYAGKLDGIAENANNYTHPNHTGDVTSDGDGATTIANDAVTNAKLANMTRGSIKVGGVSDAPTDLNAKTSGNILIGDGTDLKSVAVSGDVTISNTGAVTIGNNKVTNAKLAQMNTKTIKGNDTAGAANAKDLTVAETKALLDIDDLEAQVNSVPVSGTSKALTKSLSNTSAGITQALTVKGLTATQLVQNGNFANGTTGWIKVNADLSVNNNILSMAGQGTHNSVYINQTVSNTGFNVGNKLYAKLKIRTTSTICNRLSVYYNESVGRYIKHVDNPVQNQWYEVDGIITIISKEQTEFVIRAYYDNISDSLGQVHQVDGLYGIVGIDLTATFGAGNEPDLATCQTLFPSYFDGTKSVDKGEVTIGAGTSITRARYPKLQSVPAITDMFDVLNGLHTRNVQDVAISSGTAVNTTNYPLAKNAVGFVIALTAGGTQTGTVGTDSASGDGILYYQLETPVLSYYPPKSIPLETGSSIVHQPIMSDIVFYSSGISITDTDYPISTLQEVFKVDTETGVETQIDIATCTVASGGLSFTSTALTEDDLVWFRYEHTLDSAVPTTDYTYTTSLSGGLTTIQQDTKRVNENLQKQIDILDSEIDEIAGVLDGVQTLLEVI